MSYKEERNNELEEQLQERIVKDNFNNDIITNFFYYFESGNSKLNYYYAIKGFFNWMISNDIINCSVEEMSIDDIKKIKVVDCIKYFDSYKKDHKGTSLKTQMNFLSSFYSYLNANYDLKNIIKLVPKNKYKTVSSNREKKMPSDKEVLDLLQSIKENSYPSLRLRNEAMFWILVGTGIRASECVGLDKKDVHLDCKIPYIEVIRKGSYDEESKDIVYLNKSAIDPIKKYIESRRDDNIEALFIDNKNQRLKLRGLQGFIERNSNGNITPHMLRHYYITKLYENTRDINLVQDQAGHVAGSSITGDVYISTSGRINEVTQAKII